jgi:hypothetical protein
MFPDEDDGEAGSTPRGLPEARHFGSNAPAKLKRRGFAVDQPRRHPTP